jgi:protein SCO1/2
MRFYVLPAAIAAFAVLGPCQSQNRPQAAAESYFTDTVLLDQDGIERRFYSDLIKGKTVIINAMFTTCRDSCPVMAGNYARIQEWLGPHLGNDVTMISISVDPETDSPARLKAYAEKYKARPGWYLLTGKKQNVQLVLGKLGLYVEDKQDHLNLFLIGNDITGLWKKALGVAKPAELIQVVDSVLRDPA